MLSAIEFSAYQLGNKDVRERKERLRGREGEKRKTTYGGSTRVLGEPAFILWDTFTHGPALSQKILANKQQKAPHKKLQTHTLIINCALSSIISHTCRHCLENPSFPVSDPTSGLRLHLTQFYRRRSHFLLQLLLSSSSRGLPMSSVCDKLIPSGRCPSSTRLPPRELNTHSPRAMPSCKPHRR